MEVCSVFLWGAYAILWHSRFLTTEFLRPCAFGKNQVGTLRVHHFSSMLLQNSQSQVPEKQRFLNLQLVEDHY